MCSKDSSVGVGTPLKKRHSLNVPLGPPSPLAPLSETAHDDRVFQLAGVFQEVDNPAEFVVAVRHGLARKDLSHSHE